MFPMSPVQSWSFLLVLALLVVFTIVIIRELTTAAVPEDGVALNEVDDNEPAPVRTPRLRLVSDHGTTVPEATDRDELDRHLDAWSEVLGTALIR